MCDYDAIFNVVESKRNLYKASNELQQKINRIVVMADALHAFGSERNGYSCGQVADFNVFVPCR